MLKVDIRGEGTIDLVLLHGWGLNRHVFEPLIPLLAKRCRLHLIDLPGYGQNRHLSKLITPSAVAQAINATLPEETHWLGWSMGGLVGIQAALEDMITGSLTLIASSPAFCRRSEWITAMPRETLAGFYHDLQGNLEETVRRFIALQAMGSPHRREEIRMLREVIIGECLPSLERLNQGLKWLEELDYRHRLADIKTPIKWILGERDTLVPVKMADHLTDYLQAVDISIITRAGHAPFISHPELVASQLLEFFDENG